MPYDPQRSHRRPQLAEDAPAPIDALLGADLPSAPESTSSPRQPSAPPVATSVTPSQPVATVPPTRASGRPRLALAALVVVVLLLAVAWVRRRR